MIISGHTCCSRHCNQLKSGFLNSSHQELYVCWCKDKRCTTYKSTYNFHCAGVARDTMNSAACPITRTKAWFSARSAQTGTCVLPELHILPLFGRLFPVLCSTHPFFTVQQENKLTFFQQQMIAFSFLQVSLRVPGHEANTSRDRHHCCWPPVCVPRL